MAAAVNNTRSERRVLTQADLDRFAALSGDDNPIHVDPAFAAQTHFGRTVAHGMLLYSLICGLLSRQFPGATQITQNFMFPAPTFTDEALLLNSEVIAQEGAEVRLRTTIIRADGTITCDGEAILKLAESGGSEPA